MEIAFSDDHFVSKAFFARDIRLLLLFNSFSIWKHFSEKACSYLAA